MPAMVHFSAVGKLIPSGCLGTGASVGLETIESRFLKKSITGNYSSLSIGNVSSYPGRFNFIVYIKRNYCYLLLAVLKCKYIIYIYNIFLHPLFGMTMNQAINCILCCIKKVLNSLKYNRNPADSSERTDEFN